MIWIYIHIRNLLKSNFCGSWTSHVTFFKLVTNPKVWTNTLLKNIFLFPKLTHQIENLSHYYFAYYTLFFLKKKNYNIPQVKLNKT